MINAFEMAYIAVVGKKKKCMQRKFDGREKLDSDPAV
jgi:hypothetical protein